MMNTSGESLGWKMFWWTDLKIQEATLQFGQGNRGALEKISFY